MKNKFLPVLESLEDNMSTEYSMIFADLKTALLHSLKEKVSGILMNFGIFQNLSPSWESSDLRKFWQLTFERTYVIFVFNVSKKIIGSTKRWELQ